MCGKRRWLPQWRLPRLQVQPLRHVQPAQHARGTCTRPRSRRPVLTAGAAARGRAGLRAGSDTAFVCHPCAHIAWTRAGQAADQPCAASGRGGAGGTSEARLPGVVNFAERNSAQRSLQLPVDWARVRTLALALEQHAAAARGQAAGQDGPGGKPPLLTCWVRDASMAAGGSGRRDGEGLEPLSLEVADVASLEVVLAHALLDMPVLVNLVPPGVEGRVNSARGHGGAHREEGEGVALARESGADAAVKGVGGRQPAAESLRRGWTLESLQGKVIAGAHVRVHIHAWPCSHSPHAGSMHGLTRGPSSGPCESHAQTHSRALSGIRTRSLARSLACALTHTHSLARAHWSL